jgi:hypothetical protein
MFGQQRNDIGVIVKVPIFARPAQDTVNFSDQMPIGRELPRGLD